MFPYLKRKKQEFVTITIKTRLRKDTKLEKAIRVLNVPHRVIVTRSIIKYTP